MKPTYFYLHSLAKNKSPDMFIDVHQDIQKLTFDLHMRKDQQSLLHTSTDEYRTKLGMTKVVLRGSCGPQEGLYKVPPLQKPIGAHPI